MSKKLSFEKMLVLAALGYYGYRQTQLKKSGELSGAEKDWMLSVDKKKLFDLADQKFKLNPIQRAMMEKIYDAMMEKKDDDKAS